MSLTQRELALVAAAVAATAAWLLVVGAIRALRQPREPPEREPTLDLGPEPPALANFLARNFKVTRDAVPATLLDLAARHAVEIERVDLDTYQCRLRRPPDDETLTPYERRVLEHLQKRALDGIVPAQALTTGPGDQSSRWWKAFSREVGADARAHGLSRDLWDNGVLAALGILGAVPAVFLGLAFGADGLAYLVLPLAVVGRCRSGRRQRDTPAGLEAASRWRAVQAKLGENPVFAEQSPIAVALWRRHLAYGAALGVAGAAIRPIPMGAESARRAWSSYGGRWHEVRIRYRHSPWWGMHPGSVLLRALMIGGFGALLLYLAGTVVLDYVDEARGYELLIVTAIFAVPAALVVMASVLAARSIADLASTSEVTGEIVRLRNVTDEDGQAVRHYVAVDDGASTTLRAWLVRRELGAGLQQHQIVSAVITPRLGYVKSIERVPEPSGSREVPTSVQPSQPVG